MGTTYSRIWSALREAANRSDWDSYAELANVIREKKLIEFKLRGEGNDIADFMQESSITRLLRFMQELELIFQGPNSAALTEKGQRCIGTEDAYKRQIRSSVKSYFESQGLPWEQIIEVLGEIQLPDVPDAPTIYARIQDRDLQITEDRLRMLLFLYAKADGVARLTRVHYLGE